MNLIERYIYAVTQHLPSSQQEDVAKELHATIEDMVADSSQGKSEEIAITSVLEELGNPMILAQQYSNAKQYVIGPQWFGIYKQILVNLLRTVPFIVATIVLLSNMFGSKSHVGTAITNALGAGCGVAIQIAFWVTLVFFIMERSDTKPTEFNKSWTVAMLPELPKPRQISSFESLMGMIMIAAFGIFLILLHFKPGWFGTNSSVEVLNPELWKLWMPAFLVLLFADFVHHIRKFVVGNWTRSLVIIEVLLCLISSMFIVSLVMTQTVVNPEFVNIMAEKGLENPDEVVKWSVNITAAALVILNTWDIVETLWKKAKVGSIEKLA